MLPKKHITSLLCEGLQVNVTYLKNACCIPLKVVVQKEKKKAFRIFIPLTATLPRTTFKIMRNLWALLEKTIYCVNNRNTYRTVYTNVNTNI